MFVKSDLFPVRHHWQLLASSHTWQWIPHRLNRTCCSAKRQHITLTLCSVLCNVTANDWMVPAGVWVLQCWSQWRSIRWMRVFFCLVEFHYCFHSAEQDICFCHWSISPSLWLSGVADEECTECFDSAGAKQESVLFYRDCRLIRMWLHFLLKDKVNSLFYPNAHWSDCLALIKSCHRCEARLGKQNSWNNRNHVKGEQKGAKRLGVRDPGEGVGTDILYCNTGLCKDVPRTPLWAFTGQQLGTTDTWYFAPFIPLHVPVAQRWEDLSLRSQQSPCTPLSLGIMWLSSQPPCTLPPGWEYFAHFRSWAASRPSSHGTVSSTRRTVLLAMNHITMSKRCFFF